MGRTKLFAVALAAVGLLIVSGPAFADSPEPADIVAATGGGSYPEAGLTEPADIVAATGGGTYPVTTKSDQQVPAWGSNRVPLIAMVLAGTVGLLAILSLRRSRRVAVA